MRRAGKELREPLLNCRPIYHDGNTNIGIGYGNMAAKNKETIEANERE